MDIVKQRSNVRQLDVAKLTDVAEIMITGSVIICSVVIVNYEIKIHITVLNSEEQREELSAVHIVTINNSGEREIVNVVTHVGKIEHNGQLSVDIKHTGLENEHVEELSIDDVIIKRSDTDVELVR